MHPCDSDVSLRLYFFGSEKCSPGHSFGPFIREHFLIHIILSGQGTYHAAGKTFHLSGGDGFLILPDEVTLYQADLDNPWEYAWLGFNGRDIPDILNHCGLDSQICSDSCRLTFHCDSPLLIPLLRSLCLESRQINEYEKLGYLYRFFALLSGGESSSFTPSGQYLEKAAEFLRNHYDSDLKISQVADYIGIDRTYLYRLFMEGFGISPQRYLIDYRVKMAEEL